MSIRALRVITALSLCLVFGLAQAQEDETYADPPDRAARLSYLEGDVSLQPAGEDEWAAAIVNRPLTTGDDLWTEQDARAEIQVGQATVRLDSNTGFSFLNVDDDTIQMSLTEGIINVQVRALDENEEIEVDTPHLALSLLRPGNYRVEVNNRNDTTVVKVRDGEAQAIDGSRHVIVHDRQAVTFSAAEQLATRFSTLGTPDEFDSWSFERERRDELAASSQTAQYVDPNVTGYQDLDDNGTWSSDAEYGYLWTPTHVAADWSPYRYGRWSWVAPWGWTWIDDAPWGYAPSHYGRWAHVRNHWCWVPGPRHVRAVYAPALVGWMGPPRVSSQFNFAGVAWFPLGPREVYVPGRRFSPRYVERVNVTNTMIIRSTVREVYNNRATNVTYRNRVVPGAVTAVSRATFASAERVGDRRVRVDSQDIIRAGVTAADPQIQPVRESRLGPREQRRNVHVPPRTVVTRQVIETRASPPAANRPQADELVRRVQEAQANQDRTHQRQQQERQLQLREQQERRQVEPQQHQQREYQQQQQQHENERATRQREQQQATAQRAAAQQVATQQAAAQQAAAQQSQQRQHDNNRAQAARSSVERQTRSEPQKPAEKKWQPQKQ